MRQGPGRASPWCVVTTVFALPDRLAAKSDPALIAGDERHFAAIDTSLEHSVADLAERLDAARKQAGGTGQAALDRDQEVHRLTSRLRALRRFGLDLCLGHMVGEDDPEPVYVGRLGLTDRTGRRLLVDWRSPAAEPFFGATHADPMGLVSRRRYRWTLGRISDYWDEVFSAEGMVGHTASLDDQSAFIASLGSSRSPRMRDVLGTIQSDQDAVIRAGSRGALVVDGGPGTGKTVVALHRSAYLVYSDPRLGHHRGGVLFVGPHQPYLAYVSDVLPSLGEEGVQTCTLRDLVPEGAAAGEEDDPDVARLKASAAMVSAIEPAVRLYEEPPTEGMEVETPWADLWLSARDWAEAFESPDPGTPHNLARDQVWEELVTILLDKVDDEEVPDSLLRKALAQNEALADTFRRSWPLIEATDLVGDLWDVPAYLRRCAPWLAPEDVRRLQRADPQAWTVSDLPLLDAARLRLGDPGASRRERRRAAALAAQREEMSRVVDHLVATDNSEMQVMSMLRVSDAQSIIIDESTLEAADPDLLAGPFAHVVVDEAQELTDAEWQMLLRRCPTRSLTIVGDRAQARHGFTESWEERLARIGLDRVTVATLRINYRTPEEVMAEAEPVIRAALPDVNVPTSVRSTGVPVHHGPVTDLPEVLDAWLEEHDDGIACVIGVGEPGGTSLPESARVRWLTPELAKGLEFDLVVLLDPDTFGSGVEGAVDRYVAMTRATQRLVVLTGARG
ncbi:AAA family ATPase [Nocardioides euryhalodurans]|uniref:AAA family ATPase n=1 Tax=Nocardioides euryhalodurans TaxID=2518370 RepID=A0A4P7GI03_9ACTN|nr:AAA family ATPase [Nocardioides euryhalodurans]